MAESHLLLTVVLVAQAATEIPVAAEAHQHLAAAVAQAA
jgi:hypothetical protein